VAPINRFNVTMMGMDHEQTMLNEYEAKDQGNPFGDLIDNQGSQSAQKKEDSIIQRPEWMMGTFQNRLRNTDKSTKEREY
jgi:hypothetical protein